ncbi:MAG: hypothetical protein SD837_12030 [Candidatus Electrothrix scaldis]|nr:MAG: hypothetical protein SD837_12030 [Candidatus Electrothrix sp. GW3-3]
MTFDVALLGLGTLLLLVGLLGRVETEKLTLGTESRSARVVSWVFGVLFLTVALSPYIEYSLGTEARNTIRTILGGDRHQANYLVIYSTNSLPVARQKVKELIAGGYSAQAHRSKNGMIAIAVVISEKEPIASIKNKLLEERLCGKDAFLSTGERFAKLLYPAR